MRARASLAALLAATLLVGGCSGGDEPEAEPTPILPPSSEPAPSPSESEAAEEAPPEMPEAAREESADGSRDFIDYWAETFTYALNTGDTQELQRMSAEGCESCQGTRGVIEDVYGQGGSIESDGWRVQQFGLSPEGPSRPVVRFKRGLEVTRIPDESPERFPAGSITFEFELDRVDGEWIISDYFPVQ